MADVDLTVEILGLEFRNPVLTAAGPPSKDGATLLKAAEAGAGGLVAKTISVRPAIVYRPNMAVVNRRFYMSSGMLNVELWTELPYEQWLKREYKIAKKAGLPLIASVGYTPEEVEFLGPKVEEAGVDAIEFSTHYVTPEVVAETAKALKSVVSIPVFAKLSPMHDIENFVKAVDKYVDGYTAINSFGPTLLIDPELKMPLLGGPFGYGWISGPPLKPIAVRHVFEIFRLSDKPIMGVGGISTGVDAIEHMMAGASAVQVCTAAIVNGLGVYGKIAKEIEKWLADHGYDSVRQVVGEVARKIKDGMPTYTYARTTQLIRDRCIKCGICEKICPYDAVTLDEQRYPIIDAVRCEGCGLCVSACPTHALFIERP